MPAGDDENQLAVANDIFSKGDEALGSFRFEGARFAFERAQKIYEHTGSRLGEANCIRRLADIAVRETDGEAAAEKYDQASRLYRDLGRQASRPGLVNVPR